MGTDAPTPGKQPRRTALRTTTLMESVYQEIRARLQRGDIGPRDRILDYEIAREFDCTRMPVRQALLRLVSEGYLVGTTRGFVTPALTSVDVREIFALRRLLEPSAAASAIAVLNDEQIAGLRAACHQCRRALERQDVALMREGNAAFRTIWVDAVQNRRLRAAILRFSDHSRQVRYATMTTPGTMRMIAGGLQAMLRGFVQRDASQVRAALSAFIDDAEHQYFIAVGD